MTLPVHDSGNRPPLAIVGASARAAAASAMRAGFQPITADLFADADLRTIATATAIAPYPEGLLDWLRAIEPPAWMYTGALENYPELVDQMAWVAPLWGNPGDVLARVRSPWELADTLRDANLLFPETRADDRGLPRDGSWLVKTYRGASGSGVRELAETGRHSGLQDPSNAPCLALSLSPCLVFQQRVAGTPCAAVYVAAGGEAKLLGLTRQLIGERWLGAHGFQYCGSIGPSPMPPAALASIQQIGRVLVERFELMGLFGVDLVLDGERVWTIEVNPRYTASVEILERATGVHAVAAHAQACCEEREARDSELQATLASPQPPASSPRVHGKAIVFARSDVVITPRFAQVALQGALEAPWPTVADVPPAGTLVEAGRPILTLFATGTSTNDVQQQLETSVIQLEAQLYGTTR